MSLQREYNLRDRNVYSYEVDPNDLDNGTVTNKKTRDFVNNRGTNTYDTPPTNVSYSYNVNGTTGNGSFDNAPPTNGVWDAGHILANQNGGLGNVTQGVFPQNPSENRGGVWRQGEQGFHDAVNGQQQSGSWSTTLYAKPPPDYTNPKVPYDPNFFKNLGYE